ncbi:hypothetical protein [Pseudomonas sp. G(2018)]|uniref:hypothetical protein n=1 Tax=Pseudomonas sp. G(2018) TaxID=2502242 RepID=UPI0010F7E836|nr:hypothetical protein [Pseudomonas sp. G(2018)]
MPTMCWVNKLAKSLVLLLLGLWVINPVYAGINTSWVKNNEGQVHLRMVDGTAYDLKVIADVEGVFYDSDKHPVEGEKYISLFQVSPSNSAHPSGLCGAGSEIWLYVYQVTGAILVEKTKRLVSSCLRSISMASQNSGEPGQDSDFSSLQWNLHGFSIEWFDNVDAAGRPLWLSNFVLHDGDFLQQDVLIQDKPKN